jgi:MFS family permease
MLTVNAIRYDTGTISGILAMGYWETLFSTGYVNTNGHLDISPSQSAQVVSILSAGTFFGALTAAPFGDILGRRWGLIASSFVFIFGVILQTAATALPMFTAGRFFAGFGVGLVSALSKCSNCETLRHPCSQMMQSRFISLKRLPNGFVG